ncbi:927_t:CDS:1, partial [Racocetra persica]
LFQQERPKFNKLILSDIAIRLVFTSVHTGQIGNLVGIAPFNDMDSNKFNIRQLVNHYKVPVAGGETMMTPLLSKMGLNFYLVRICDKDLAKKTQDDITPADILKNPEKLDNPELKDGFEILAKYYGEISCDNTGCLLKDWNFYLCYQFDKDEQRVCLLPEDNEIQMNLFDTANFALIMVVDYMPGFLKMRRLRTKIPPPDPAQPNNPDPRYITDRNSYFLGQQFSFNAGQT